MEIVETSQFQAIIPHTLRNWKSETVAALFSAPTDTILSKVNVNIPFFHLLLKKHLKQEMKDRGYDHHLSIQFRSILMQEKGPIDAARFFACASKLTYPKIK